MNNKMLITLSNNHTINVFNIVKFIEHGDFVELVMGGRNHTEYIETDEYDKIVKLLSCKL